MKSNLQNMSRLELKVASFLSSIRIVAYHWNSHQECCDNELNYVKQMSVSKDNDYCYRWNQILSFQRSNRKYYSGTDYKTLSAHASVEHILKEFVLSTAMSVIEGNRYVCLRVACSLELLKVNHSCHCRDRSIDTCNIRRWQTLYASTARLEYNEIIHI